MRLNKLNQFTDEIMRLMASIEDRKQLMFSQIDEELEVRIFQAIDDKNVSKLRNIIDELWYMDANL